MNRDAFKVKTFGTYGTLGPNTYTGPGFFGLGFGLRKDFPITERVTTQFRFEAFNVFNKVNLRNPTSHVTSSNFMRITSASDPRILQFALRLSF